MILLVNQVIKINTKHLAESLQLDVCHKFLVHFNPGDDVFVYVVSSKLELMCEVKLEGQTDILMNVMVRFCNMPNNYT